MFSRESARGFTLIELMVVIAIIGILTAIGAVNYAASRQKARDAKRVSDLEEISLALEVYRQSEPTRKYPTEAQGLAVLATKGILTNIPKDPKTKLDYYYETSCVTKTVVVAQMEDMSRGNNVGLCPVTTVTGRYTVTVGPAAE